jgi:iron complex transport system ATP-binding protein
LRGALVQSEIPAMGFGNRRAALAAFILAGGKSSRMGKDKARALLGGRTFLDRVATTARAVADEVHVIRQDVVPHRGPLGGVLTAFEEHRFARGLFLACDMPLVTVESLRELAQKSTSAAFYSINGKAGFPFLLPLAARRVVRAQLNSDNPSVNGLAHALNATFLPGSAPALTNINTPADLAEAEAAWRRERAGAVLEVRNLCVRRGDTKLIWDFSWKVRPNEHWVVLGPNGCGKTSLFSSLLGYLTPTAGEIFLLGEEYGGTDWPALRQRIGLVSSSVRQLMPEAEPAWITVASGRYAMIDFWGTPKRGDRARAMELLREVECEYLAEKPWAVLSQGERQRVLIGRALMAHPTLLILDEPCAGLDPAAREQFLDFLNRLGRAKNAPTLVLVTHHVDEIMPVFTHALLMKGGNKFAEGPLESTLSAANLANTFGASIRLRKRDGRYAMQLSPRRNLIA